MIRPLGEAARAWVRAQSLIGGPGEAVEELVSNSIDAGAGQVTVRLLSPDGLSLEVSDDGSGIPDGVLAELGVWGRSTRAPGRKLGYRGESLAALVTLSRQVRVSTRTPGNPARVRLLRSDTQGEGRVAEVGERDTCGTSVRVDGLLHALPARCASAQQSGADEVMRAASRLAVCFPLVAFRVCDASGEPLLNRRPCLGPVEAYAAVLGAQRAEAMKPVSSARPGLRVSGAVAVGAAAKGGLRLWVVNGRPCSIPLGDASLMRLYARSRRSGTSALQAFGQPTWFLDIQCPPADAEFSSGGCRSDVVFRRAQEAAAAICDAAAAALRSVGFTVPPSLGPLGGANVRLSRVAVQPSRGTAPVATNCGEDAAVMTRKRRAISHSPPREGSSRGAQAGGVEQLQMQMERTAVGRLETRGQAGRRVLVCVMQHEGRTLVVAVDQHAADERVKLEALRAMLPGLVSEPECLPQEARETLGSVDAVSIGRSLATLTRWGWLAQLEQGRLLVRRCPALSFPEWAAAPRRVVLSRVSDLLAAASAPEGALPECVTRAMQTKACRSAVMFGDALTAH
eukprot:Hpha_TRINITY_DN30386_c0_g1::TRINITY_DN30386_c0_g1_i1::g.146946::m.146946/K03572/mutL; DNA mismatch repair protein MutL